MLPPRLTSLCTDFERFGNVFHRGKTEKLVVSLGKITHWLPSVLGNSPLQPNLHTSTQLKGEHHFTQNVIVLLRINLRDNSSHYNESRA